ncbi:hypothetical protein G9A89_014736 [Geosiphon pyriformis]|nr:hypothetical protein G9A89_014736 [Geosiphon pyriformis]
MNNVSSNNRDNNVLFGVDNSFFFGLAVNTPKVKRINTGLICDFLLSLIDYGIDKDVSINKFFVLDINLSAIKEKSVMAKTQAVKKLFSLINGFGRVTTPLKFKEIIRFIFTSKISIIKTILLAEENEIIVNVNVKKQEIHLNQAVVIKKILIDMPKKMIVTAISEFGKIKSIKIQLIKIKNSVYETMAVGDCNIWTSKD